MTKEQLGTGIKLNGQIEEVKEFIASLTNSDFRATNKNGCIVSVPDNLHSLYMECMNRAKSESIHQFNNLLGDLSSQFDEL